MAKAWPFVLPVGSSSYTYDSYASTSTSAYVETYAEGSSARTRGCVSAEGCVGGGCEFGVGWEGWMVSRCREDGRMGMGGCRCRLLVGGSVESVMTGRTKSRTGRESADGDDATMTMKRRRRRRTDVGLGVGAGVVGATATTATRRRRKNPATVSAAVIITHATGPSATARATHPNSNPIVNPDPNPHQERNQPTNLNPKKTREAKKETRKTRKETKKEKGREEKENQKQTNAKESGKAKSAWTSSASTSTCSASSLSTPVRAPSSMLLKCLAGMLACALPLGVEGRPAPLLGFLYPWMEGEEADVTRRDGNVDERKRRRSRRKRGEYRVASDSRHVPNRFERDEDGKWRRVSEYTLYGSTVANGCSEPKCRTNNVVSNLDGNIQVPSNNTTNSAIGISGPLEMKDLPPGWQPLEKSSEARTTLILALSLVLASFICFFVIGCLFWRKTVKRRYKDDVEKARRRRRNVVKEEEREKDWEKQKLWARATARWKANVRQRYRKRRVRSIRSGTTSVLRERGRESSVLSSRRSSMSSGRSRSGSRERSRSRSRERSLSPTPSRSDTISASASDSAAAALPPAYHHRHGLAPRNPPTSEDSLVACTDMDMDDGGDGDLGTLHVATDDKGVLARLARLASAPPEEDGECGCGSGMRGEGGAIVPEWDEEGMDVILPLGGSTSFVPSPLTLSQSPTRAQSPSQSTLPSLPPPPLPPPQVTHPLFPPPPEKIRQEYDYGYQSYEEMTMVVEPDPGPSAPPFEASVPVFEASAPPFLPSVGFEASAPFGPSAPVFGEEVMGGAPVFGEDVMASAPPLDVVEEEGLGVVSVGEDRGIRRTNGESEDEGVSSVLPGYRP